MTAVRRATHADVDAILEVWASSRTAHATTTDTPAGVHAVLDRSAIFVAEADGALVGTVIAAWDGWRGSMYRLAVLSDQRRGGIGLALVRAAEAWLVEQGARRINVLVAFEDEGARSLWRAAGFEDDDVIGRLFRNV